MSPGHHPLVPPQLLPYQFIIATTPHSPFADDCIVPDEPPPSPLDIDEVSVKKVAVTGSRTDAPSDSMKREPGFIESSSFLRGSTNSSRDDVPVLLRQG